MKRNEDLYEEKEFMENVLGLFICGISYHYCHSVLSEGSVYSICCRGTVSYTHLTLPTT